MTKIVPKWGEWGVFTFQDFKRMFASSDELMKAELSGYFSWEVAIEEIVRNELSMTKDSLQPGLTLGLNKFASNHMPIRFQDRFGKSNVYNPQRDNRPGAATAIPSRAPDVFKPVLEGDEEKGHAILAAFDQDVNQDLDDLLDVTVDTRNLIGLSAHALTIVNRFPAYVRLADKNLVTLLHETGYYRRDDVIRSLPHGINLVSFPVAYAESLSTMPVLDVFAVLLSTQKALQRSMAVGNLSMPYDVFFNIGPLVGGTIPRIHLQTYVRTRLDVNEMVLSQPENHSMMKDYGKSSVHKLQQNNRNWEAYVPPVREGKFDIKMELKSEQQKEFWEFSPEELWDVSEMLIYNSGVFDTYEQIPARNIQFFSSGVVVSPFASKGGHEHEKVENIFGKTPESFALDYNMRVPTLSSAQLYQKPGDLQGQATFDRLFDADSPILQMVK